MCSREHRSNRSVTPPTHTHPREPEKCRVWFPTNRPVEPHEHRALHMGLAEIMENGGGHSIKVVKVTDDLEVLAQIAYLPSHPPGAKGVFAPSRQPRCWRLPRC